jgi:hypothetical protein
MAQTGSDDLLHEPVVMTDLIIVSPNPMSCQTHDEKGFGSSGDEVVAIFYFIK